MKRITMKSYSWWEEIIVHEIAHQYFPFMVGTNSYTEPFIDEPFAVWTSIYFLESQGRIADAEEAIDYRYTAYEAYTYDHGDYRLDNTMGYWAGLNDGYPYYHIVYNKGAIVLEMLERYLGTDVFLDCLKGIYQTFVGGNLFFSDFKEVFNEISGLNLDWYFNQWFHTAGLPRLRLDATTTDGYTIDIEITNTDKEWFKLPLLLEIDTPIDDYSKVIWVNGSLTEISITLDNYAEEGTVYLARNKLLLRTIYTTQIKDTIRFVTDESKLELMIAIPIIFASLGIIKLWRKKRRG
ncbi:MAG: M1 family aminopeptidase [Candidatus Heimdallarchaeota archaeon]